MCITITNPAVLFGWLAMCWLMWSIVVAEIANPGCCERLWRTMLCVLRHRDHWRFRAEGDWIGYECGQCGDRWVTPR